MATRKHAASEQRSSDHRLFAIGDVHGCADELAVMLKALELRAGDTIVFVGDYIDRGPDARGVVELVLELQKGAATAVFLKGNHEDMLLSYLGLPGHYGESFLFNGGMQTIASYGLKRADPAEACAALPAPHLEFFRSLTNNYQRPPYLFVHAGVRPGLPLEDQEAEDLLWIRHEFIFSPHQLDATVVFGHTPMRTVMTDLPYKIGVDTGLVYGGSLSCVEFSEGVLYQVGRGSRAVKKSAIKVI
ncbi:MAG TPA: metallophosphoesterase family protein [Candidatus Binataceae bacterium]|nr:metallophosphoesterase family protein [Candidatus Binataceae bacterium]